MDFQKVILRKILDDPKTRLKAYQIFKPEHFKNKYQRYLFKIIKDFHNRIVTFDQIVDFISSKNLKDQVHGKLAEEIGEIFEGKSPLEADFEYAIKAISTEAEVTSLCQGIQSAAVELSRGNVDEAKRLLSESSRASGNFKVASENNKSSRALASLRPRTVESNYKTGFRKFDELTGGGGRRGELWTWAAYTGEMKSTAMLAIAHNLFITKKRVLFVTLEMKTETEIMPRIISQHAMHLSKLIPFVEVETHKFTSKENASNHAKVVKDYQENTDYGELTIYEPSHGCTIEDVFREVELGSSKEPFDVVILDYIQKLSPLDRKREHRLEIAETLALAKRKAMDVLAKQGVFLLSGYQISSDGRKNAEKNGEKYDLWCLSETIAAAQEPNVILWSLLTESMRRNKEVKLGMMKSRNTAIDGSIHFVPVDLNFGLIGKEAITHPDEMDITQLDGLTEEGE